MFELIMGGACFVAGVLCTRIYVDMEADKERREKMIRRKQAYNGMSQREYQLKHNDVYRANVNRYGR